MNVTLPQIQFKLAEAEALRGESLNTMLALALGQMEADRETRQQLVSRFRGYEREFWALVKIERELIAHGRASVPNDEPQKRRFDEPVPPSAVSTPLSDSDASSASRGASRVAVDNPLNPNTSPVSPGGPPPANLPAWGTPEATAMIAEHYTSGDGF